MTRQVLTVFLSVTWLMLGAMGCSDDSGTSNTCPDGQVRVGDKCVPANVDLGPGGDAAPGDASGADQQASDKGPAADQTPSADQAGGDSASGPIVVFDDNYGADVTFADFGGATNAVSIDTTEKQSGSASLKIEVPASGYTGGAFVLGAPGDLSAYDAVTFWAKASAAHTLNTVGLGNTGQSTTLQAEIGALPLTTSWQKFIVPIPLASKLTQESGVFHFAEGADEGAYTIWIDEIRYETLGSGVLGAPAPAMATSTENLLVGGNTQVAGLSVVIKVNGTDVVVNAKAPYFTFSSSDTNVATVDAEGKVSAVAVGSAEITAKLGATDAAGKLTVTVANATAPTAAAPAPTKTSANVISLFSDVYTDVTVDTWSASWDSADVVDEAVAGNATKKYTNMVFAGVEFTTAPVNASTMTNIHFDIWSPNATSFKIKLVDFGADKAFGGGDDTEHELTYDSASTPAIVTGSWISFDIPLSSFTGMTSRGAVAQMILSSSNATVYVDNIYFWK